MRRFFGVIVLVLLVALVAMAGDKAPLSDRQLAAVTAGQDFNFEAASGAVVANGSNATISKTGAVNVADGAQSGIQAMNLANLSASKFASGINAWDGSVATAPTDGTVSTAKYDDHRYNPADVKASQSNVIA